MSSETMLRCDICGVEERNREIWVQHWWRVSLAHGAAGRELGFDVCLKCASESLPLELIERYAKREVRG
jgi:hypothetical protein